MTMFFSMASLLVVCQYFCMEPVVKSKTHLCCHESSKKDSPKACCKSHGVPFAKGVADDFSQSSKIIVSFVFTLPINQSCLTQQPLLLHPAVHGPPGIASRPIYLIKNVFLI